MQNTRYKIQDTQPRLAVEARRARYKIQDTRYKGFTLVELLVVGSIIALISAIFIVGFRGGEEEFALQRSTHMLAQDIRRVQELAMRAEDFEGSVSRGGFGIHLESATSSYILFADCDEDRLFDATGDPAILCVDALLFGSRPELLEIRELEQGVTITSILPNPTSTIVFIPPDPAVRINDSLATSTTIVLGINGLTATVTVNKAGLIAIE